MRCKYCGVPSSHYVNWKHASRRSCRVNGYHSFVRYTSYWCSSLCKIFSSKNKCGNSYSDLEREFILERIMTANQSSEKSKTL
jgi:hypothetical protein